MDGAARARTARQGDIQPFFAQAGIKGGIGKPCLLGAQGGVDFILQHVQHGASGFALVGVHLAQPRHQRRNLALFAKGSHAQIFQRGLGLAYLLKPLLLVGHPIGHFVATLVAVLILGLPMSASAGVSALAIFEASTCWRSARRASAFCWNRNTASSRSVIRASFIDE